MDSDKNKISIVDYIDSVIARQDKNIKSGINIYNSAIAKRFFIDTKKYLCSKDYEYSILPLPLPVAMSHTLYWGLRLIDSLEDSCGHNRCLARCNFLYGFSSDCYESWVEVGKAMNAKSVLKQFSCNLNPIAD